MNKNINDALVEALEAEYDAIDMYARLAENEINIPERRDRYIEIMTDERVHAAMLQKYIYGRPVTTKYPITLEGAIQSEIDAINMYSDILRMTTDENLTEDLRHIIKDEKEHLEELREL